MTEYVMFGTHPFFGDYVDAIHAAGGILTRVVQNMEEPPRPPGQRFADQLDRYQAWLSGRGSDHAVEVVPLDRFVPRDGERYLFGFRGLKLLPLRDRLLADFGLRFAPLVHPTAYVSPTASIGEGVFVGAGSTVGSDAAVGEFTLINRAAVIEHDCVIGPCANIGPAAAVASSVRIGPGAVLGIKSVVIEKLTLGAECYVAGGSVVIGPVPGGVLVAGVPAVEKRRLSRN